MIRIKKRAIDGIQVVIHHSDDYFVYSYALAGRQESMLVSDVVNCQLGGGIFSLFCCLAFAQVHEATLCDHGTAN